MRIAHKLIAATTFCLLVLSSVLTIGTKAQGQAPAQAGSKAQQILERYVHWLGESRILKQQEDALVAEHTKIDTEYEACAEKFRAAGTTYENERDKAVLEDGDPVANFAEARNAKAEYDRLAKEAQTLYDQRQNKSRDLYNTRNQRLRAETLLRQETTNLFKEVARSLGDKNDYSFAVRKVVRAMENELVQAAKSKAAGNNKLATAIAEYEKALTEVESKDAVHDAAREATRSPDWRKEWEREHEYERKIDQVLSQKANAVSADEYKALRDEGRELAKLNKKKAANRVIFDKACDEFVKAREVYDEAFRAVIQALAQ